MLVLPEPDTITFNAAITACGRGKKWKPAVELLDSMRREGLVPDGFSYSAAITACKNCGQWETALGLLDDMRMRGLGRDRHSLNAAIAACASAGRWKPAMEILEGMEEKGPSPDVFTYGAVIDALAHGGEVDLALRTLKRMRSNPSRYPAPNTVCHNAALMALMRDGRWREARGLLSEVASATPATGGGVELDFLSYNTVIRACAAAGEAEEALKTREEMRAAGIPADAYTYEALSTACGSAGDWEAAEAVVREMVAGCSSSSSSAAAAAATAAAEVPSPATEGGGSATGVIPPATEGVAAAAAAESSAKEDEEEEDSWSQTLRHRQRRRRERLKNGVPPSPRVFHGLMEAYSRAGEWERAQQCLDDMRQGSGWLPEDDGQERVGAGTGVKPDSTSVGWAIQACAAAGQWDRALATFAGAKSDGIQPGQLCFDAALLACAVGGQGARATSLLAEMATLESEHRLARLGEEENASPSLGANNQGGRTVPQPSEDDAAPRRSTDSYRLGMEACRRGGDTRGVMSTFVIMEEEGFEADVEEEEEEAAARSAEATQTAAAAGMLPSLSPAIYAAAANALADVGEWEWCMVLLEELEQLDAEQDDGATGATATTTAAALSPPPPAGVALASAGDDNNGEEQEAPETVLRVELDENGALAAPATATSQKEGSAPEAAAAATAAAYTAAVRACGEGGAGVQTVVGVLERMRWVGVDPGEDAYAAAVSAFRACGGGGGAREGEEGSGRGVLSAEEAARALVEHETGRDGAADWASPFLYRMLFVEGRRAAGVATDDAAEVAAAAVAAAAAAADSGTAPKRPARVNAGVEAVYMSCLTMCAAAGDGSLARDVLRWMKLEGFQASEEAYMLAIEACCNPAVPQDPPAAPQQPSSFTTPPATSRQRLPLPPPTFASGATSPEDLAGVRRKLFSEGEAPESEQHSAAAATSDVVTRIPPPPRDDGDDGVAAALRPATAGTSVPGVGDPASSVDEDVERGRVAEEMPAAVAAAAAAESLNQQRPQPPLGEEEERKAERPELEWVVIPGGRVSPPEFDEDGNEKSIAPPGTMGGAAWATGGAKAGAGGSGAVGFGGGDGAPFPREGEVTTAAASRRDGDAGTTSPASARADVSRAGAVNVLSPLAAAAPAAPAAAGGGRSNGQRLTPGVDPDAVVVAAGSSSTPTAAAADEGGSSSVPGSGASSTDSNRSVNNSSNNGRGGGGADWERARAILDDMTAADHLPPPPEEAFRAVLGACDSAGRVGEALEIAQVMVGAGFSPSIALMSRLIASHADELDRERREMEEAAAEPAEEWGETS
ncbi:unnamed protein product [Ectocarpus sp. 6 AP-2014]